MYNVLMQLIFYTQLFQVLTLTFIQPVSYMSWFFITVTFSAFKAQQQVPVDDWSLTVV